MPRVAVLVAGTLLRYFLTSTCKHVIQPLVQKGHSVDYYLALSTGEHTPWRVTEATAHLTLDPIFGSKPHAQEHIVHTIEQSISQAGGTLRCLALREAVKLDDTRLIHALDARTHAGPDPFANFPIMSHGNGSVSSANRNFLSVYKALEELWDAAEATEAAQGWRYNWVLVLRDDADWLRDFDLEAVIRSSSGVLKHADVYTLACDARTPPMHPSETCDHVMLLSRSHAPLLGRYYSQTVLAGAPDACRVQVNTRGVHLPLPSNNHSGAEPEKLLRCASEELLRWTLVQNHVRFVAVGQGLFPFQRSAHVRLHNTTTVCWHKFCQSTAFPLQGLPARPMCKDINFLGSPPRPDMAGNQGGYTRNLTAKPKGDRLQQATGSSRCMCQNQSQQACPALQHGVNQPFCNQSRNAYLLSLAKELRDQGEQCITVVYQVSFGDRYERMSGAVPLTLKSRSCFFRFTLGVDGKVASPTIQKTGYGWDKGMNASRGIAVGAFVARVVVDKDNLPFDVSMMRRNAKVFKMLGPLLFPWAQQVIWIDSKLSQAIGNDMRLTVMTSLLNATGACAAFVGLPAHRFAFGERPLATNQRLTLSLHAQQIEAASRHRSTTDSIDLLHKQVHAYTVEKAASSSSRVRSSTVLSSCRTRQPRSAVHIMQSSAARG